MDTWRILSHISKLKKRKENDKKIKESQKKKERRRQTGSERERRGEREEGVFCFSLRFMKIESSVFIRARRKVDPRIASYAWVPKSWSFVKLHKVGNFPTLNIFSLKVM